MNRSTLFASALLACSAAACASTPSGAPRTANGESANVTTTTTVRDVAVGNDNEGARRELGEDPFDDGTKLGSKKSERAKAASQEQHDIYRGQATTRLDQANARIVAAQTKLAKAGARAGADARSRVDAAAAQRTLVSQQISQLPIARDDQWNATTKSIDASLQTLDALTAAAVEATDKL